MEDDSDSDEDSESDDGWVDVKQDGDAAEVAGDAEEGDADVDDSDEDDNEESDNEDIEDESEEASDDEGDKDESTIKNVEVMDEKTAAQELALTRLFTDDDFKRIDAEIIKKHTQNARKRPLEAEKSEYVRLDDIEMIYKKRKADKQARLESVLKGRTGREKYGYRDKRQNIHCSKTNTEKKKKKNFGMMRHKARSKVKRSFKDKQLDMRKHLLKQKKMK